MVRPQSLEAIIRIDVACFGTTIRRIATNECRRIRIVFVVVVDLDDKGGTWDMLVRWLTVDTAKSVLLCLTTRVPRIDGQTI